MTRTTAILVFPDFQLLDAAGPITAFEAGGRETAPPAYRLRGIGRAAGPVASSSGVQLVAEAFPADPLDTLIVAGGWGTRQESACAETLAFIRAAAGRARRIARLVSGALFLPGGRVVA